MLVNTGIDGELLVLRWIERTFCNPPLGSAVLSFVMIASILSLISFGCCEKRPALIEIQGPLFMFKYVALMVSVIRKTVDSIDDFKGSSMGKGNFLLRKKLRPMSFGKRGRILESAKKTSKLAHNFRFASKVLYFFLRLEIAITFVMHSTPA